LHKQQHELQKLHEAKKQLAERATKLLGHRRELEEKLAKSTAQLASLRTLAKHQQSELARLQDDLRIARKEHEELRKTNDQRAAPRGPAERKALMKIAGLEREKQELSIQLMSAQTHLLAMEKNHELLVVQLDLHRKGNNDQPGGAVAESLPRLVDPESAGKGNNAQAKTPLQNSDFWRFLPRHPGQLAIRQRPIINGPRTAARLNPGDVFQVAEQRKGENDVVFLRLASGVGWVFDRIPGAGVLCVPFSPPPGGTSLEPYRHRLPPIKAPPALARKLGKRGAPRPGSVKLPRLRHSLAPWRC
jgi:hypothetical protein